MQITLTKEESEEFFYNALCNGLSYFCGYGLVLTYLKEHYQTSAEKLKKEQGPGIAYEDVLMQMLRNGYTLTFEDEEGEGEQTKQITLRDVHEGVLKTPAEHLIDMKEENDDADTADAIIQSVLYGEIIFG